MASHIKVDLEIMRETVRKYDDAKGKLNDTIEAMNSAVRSVYWTGEAAQAFLEQFSQLYTNLKNSDSIMQDAENDLKQTIDKMDTADKAAKTAAAKIDEGNVTLPI